VRLVPKSKQIISMLNDSNSSCHVAMTHIPPSHPLSLSSQSTRICSDRDVSSPVSMNLAPSIKPVALKAQQNPLTCQQGKYSKKISFRFESNAYWLKYTGVILSRKQKSVKDGTIRQPSPYLLVLHWSHSSGLDPINFLGKIFLF
jgi:hypothetical protein